MVLFSLLGLMVAGPALAETVMQASVKGASPDTWCTMDDRRVRTFWADVNQDKSADVFFAMHGVNYRQVRIDSDADGRPDLVFLHDDPGGYLRFFDSDGNGLWELVPEVSFPGNDTRMRAAQKILLAGVERRIIMDESTVKWTASNETSTQILPVISSVGFTSLTLRMTHTPSSLALDPQRLLQPRLWVERKFQLMPGGQATWETTLPHASHSDEATGEISIGLALFELLVETPSETAESQPRRIVQVAGRIDTDEGAAGLFSALLDTGGASPAVATVPIRTSGARDLGNLFIEIFLGAELGK